MMISDQIRDDPAIVWHNKQINQTNLTPIFTLTELSYQYKIALFLSVEKFKKGVIRDNSTCHLG
ncbi:MAG TPA: hypothetical protein DEF07_02620 [Nitrosomonas sp.]|nr:hypothetical protein [Nitrosomonas sp.]